jgi:hypothetical protein
MSELTSKQAELQADVWDHIDKVESALAALRNALQHTGVGHASAQAAHLVAHRANTLLLAAAGGQGYNLGLRDAARGKR